MKIVKKIFGILASFMLIGTLGLTSCSDSDDGDDSSGSTSIENEVTVNVGGDKVEVYIPGRSTWQITDSDKEGYLEIAAVEEKADYFTIKASSSAKEGDVTVYFLSDTLPDTDENYAFALTVHIYNPYVKLPIALGSGFTSVSKIEVSYDNNKTAGDAGYESRTVEAVYDKTDSIWYVSFEKALADGNYKCFSHITVKVYTDTAYTEGTSTECNPTWFNYTVTDSAVDGYADGLSVSPVVKSKTFTINFVGFTIPGGSVEGLKYNGTWEEAGTWQSDYVKQPTVTVATDGASATFEVSASDLDDKKAFYIDWTAVVFKNSSEVEVTGVTGLPKNTSSSAANNHWYAYSGDDWSETATVVTGTYTTLLNISSKGFNLSEGQEGVTISEDSGFLNLATSEGLSGYTISSLKITASNLSSGAWLSLTSKVGWDGVNISITNNNNELTVTDSTTIATLLSSGIYIVGSSGTTGTITVEYIGTAPAAAN